MTSPVWAFQQAVYSRLDAAFAPVKVFDHAPQNTAAPFVDIGDMDTRQDDLLAANGARRTAVTFVIAAWGDPTQRGQKSLHEMADTITAALHEQQGAMTLATGSVVYIRVTTSRVVTESDGIARSVLVGVSAYLQH